MNSLNITISGQPYPHLLFHFMLPYSRWEAVVSHTNNLLLIIDQDAPDLGAGVFRPRRYVRGEFEEASVPFLGNHLFHFSIVIKRQRMSLSLFCSTQGVSKAMSTPRAHTLSGEPKTVVVA